MNEETELQRQLLEAIGKLPMQTKKDYLTGKITLEELLEAASKVRE